MPALRQPVPVRLGAPSAAARPRHAGVAPPRRDRPLAAAGRNEVLHLERRVEVRVGHWRGFPGREVVAAGDLDLDLVLADAEQVAIAEGVRAIRPERFVRTVDECAVGAGIAQEPGAAAVLDLGMATGYEALGVAQHPVVAGVTADAAAVHAERPA